MKKIVTLYFTALLALMFTGTSQAQNERIMTMWVWDFYTAVSTQEQRNELIRFSVENKINQLFISTNLLTLHPTDYEDLIQSAHKQGIRIFSLAGHPSWALAEKHHYPLERIQEVLDYNLSHPFSQFDGIHHDIEPYLLPGYFDNVDSISSQFLQLLQASVDLIADNDLEYDVAIPFWYTVGARPIIFESKPLAYHILEIADSVSIMAYRDNSDAQINLSKSLIQFAAAEGKKAYVGMETMPPNGEAIPESITYYHKTTEYMNEQLENIRKYYQENPGFAGTAIHSYDSYKAMQKKEADEKYRILEEKFNVLKEAGILKGYADGSAGFGRTSTRAEAAVIAARLGGYSDVNLYNPAKASFSDVPPHNWSYGWIESVRKMGVMNGKSKNIFDPSSNITVEETLIVVARSLGLFEVEGSEVQGASLWAQGWIQALLNEDLIEKRDDYTHELTREDLITFVYDLYTSHIYASANNPH